MAAAASAAKVLHRSSCERSPASAAADAETLGKAVGGGTASQIVPEVERRAHMLASRCVALRRVGRTRRAWIPLWCFVLRKEREGEKVSSCNRSTGHYRAHFLVNDQREHPSSSSPLILVNDQREHPSSSPPVYVSASVPENQLM